MLNLWHDNNANTKDYVDFFLFFKKDYVELVVRQQFILFTYH